MRTAGVEGEDSESDGEYESDEPHTAEGEQTHLTGDLEQKVRLFNVFICRYCIDVLFRR